MEKRFKELWKNIRDYFSNLELEEHTPLLEHHVSQFQDDFPGLSLSMFESRAQQAERLARNAQAIELTKLKQERDAINLNLKSQHKIMIATLLTAFAAVVSAVIALIISIHQKPPVVNLKVPYEQKTIQTSN